jgi:hypothetical protein
VVHLHVSICSPGIHSLILTLFPLDPNRVYEFELSVRKPRRGLGVYLTFRGARRVLSLNGVLDSESKVPGPMAVPSHAADGPSNSYLPVLQDVTVSTKTSNASTDTFASSHSGCGIIEVGRYGAIPLSTSGKMQVARTIVYIKAVVLISSYISSL